MARNVRTYDHFCVLARALELVGDRWSLLVIRDLLTGSKRFTDLMDRLGGITPKTLTMRLRELGDAGIVEVDREPGRREVRYRLTPVGQDLGPAIENLAWWGWQHAWRPPAPGEPVHGEHLLLLLRVVLDREAADGEPTRWHIRFVDDGEYTVESDGERWSVTSSPPEGPVDVTVVGTMAGLQQFVRNPSVAGAADAGMELDGDPHAVQRLRRLLRYFQQQAVR